MWDRLFEPAFTRVNVPRRQLWSFAQEAIHQAVRARQGQVLVCDGEHGFNPYDYAELNLVRGFPADLAASRVLTKRAMTAFQWDTILDRHVARKMVEAETALVVAAPYDRLFLHEELRDWEAEDHLRFSVGDMKEKAERHNTPILALVDLPRLWRDNPAMAAILEEGVPRKWSVRAEGGAWLMADEAEGPLAKPWRTRPGTLDAFLPDAAPVEELEPLPPMGIRHGGQRHPWNQG
ncbi:MAG TPA: hypothetical protein VM286_01380 [Candidatus Thermoplasmatota archaeon]|nr:hypothetical protein [Candidatus Thermoplasmatota archaeon]